MRDFGGLARATLATWVVAIATATAAADETLYYSCQSCHESDGSGNEAIGAPAIAGMNADYVAIQMRKFRDGVRGASIDDLAGRQMSLIASIFADDAEISAVADLVESMKKATPQPTMEAVTGRGAELFEQCAACHGETGAGNPELQAPAIAQLNDWYIRSQLMRFRDGTRGVHPDDQSGAQMKAAVTAISDESIYELSVYVAALNNE